MFKLLTQFIQDKFESNSYIPLHEPRFIGNEKILVNSAIDSTFVSSVGKHVEEFERSLADYTKSEKAIALVNGTSALHLSMLLAKVTDGDYVITQALTFVATCNAINYCNAEPIFIDVDKDTLGLSPTSLESWLSENAFVDGNVCRLKKNNRPVRACVPMHTFGHPTKIDQIVDICAIWNIAIIEDAAESLGSFYKGIHTGNFGSMGALSFNGNKIITTGGGGAILCNSAIYAQGKHLSTTAKLQDDINFYHDQIGYNYRMPNLNAALGCAQLESLNTFIKKKRNLAKEYSEICEQSNLNFFIEPRHCRSNYWLNTIICEDKTEKDMLLSCMIKKKILSRPVWTPMNELPMFKTSLHDGLKNTTWLAERIVNMPSSVV